MQAAPVTALVPLHDAGRRTRWWSGEHQVPPTGKRLERLKWVFATRLCQWGHGSSSWGRSEVHMGVTRHVSTGKTIRCPSQDNMTTPQPLRSRYVHSQRLTVGGGSTGSMRHCRAS